MTPVPCWTRADTLAPKESDETLAPQNPVKTLSKPCLPSCRIWLFPGTRGPKEADELVARNGFIKNESYYWGEHPKEQSKV